MGPTPWTRALALGLLLFACSSASKAEQLGAAEPHDRVGYPRARWRVDPSSLNEVAFMLERIVVAHDAVVPSPYEVAGVAPNTRSRDQALALARALSREAQAEPEHFAELAMRHSDDRNGRVVGGALGLVRATMIAPELVDALAVVQEGQVSDPIETASGFQIVRRLPPPIEQTVRGEAILLRHAELRGPFGPPSIRGRARQRLLAERVYATALLGADFAALIAKYGEQDDLSYGGSLGVRSTRSADSDSFVTYVLAGLQVGEVAPPVETVRGIAIVRRLPSVCAARLARSEIVIGHREVTRIDLDDQRTRAEAAALARTLAAQSAEDPGAFSALQHAHCDGRACSARVLAWDVGERGRPLDEHVRMLAIGEIAGEPFEDVLGFHVIRREEPPRADEHAGALSFQLPEPHAQTYADLLAQAPGAYLARFTDHEGKEFVAREQLEPTTSARFLSFLESFVSELAESIPEGRRALMEQANARLYSIVGEAGARRFAVFLDERLELLQRKLGD